MSNNENSSIYDDPSWQAYIEQAETMSDTELNYAIDAAYEKNKNHIEALKNADVPEDVIDEAEVLNESAHNMAHSAELIIPEQKIKDEVKRTRFAALKSLGSALKQALITVRMCAVSTYDFIITPVQKIDIAINKADAKGYKKTIARLESKLVKEKEKVNEKALVRLRKINLKNMRGGKAVYDESMLPYTPAEQEKLDAIVKRIRNVRQKLEYTQNEINKCERRLLSRKSFIERDKQALLEGKRHIENETMVKKDPADVSVSSHINDKSNDVEKISPVKKKTAESKQKKRLTPDEYAAINSHHLSDAQFKTAILLVKNFPGIGLEHELTHDIPVNKMPFLAKAYAELKDSVEFDSLKALTISEISSLARGLKECAITKDEAVEAVSMLQTKSKKEPVVEPEHVEIAEPEAHTADVESDAIIEPSTPESVEPGEPTVIDLDENEKSLDEDIRKANLAAAEKSSQRNKDIVQEVFKTISDDLPNGSSIEFEVDGEMYKAIRNESGSVSFKVYDWEMSYYEHISKPAMTNRFLRHASEFRTAVNAQFNREEVRDL